MKGGAACIAKLNKIAKFLHYYFPRLAFLCSEWGYHLTVMGQFTYLYTRLWVGCITTKPCKKFADVETGSVDNDTTQTGGVAIARSEVQRSIGSIVAPDKLTMLN